jgi:DNA-binding LytR/AlgR family response regulator
MVENVSCFSDLSLFFSSIEEGHLYEAVLMDINWEQKKTGMDAATELYKCSPETRVIYVTRYSEKYAQLIFLHQANLSGYITKPVDVEILEANLQKVAAALPYSEQPALVVRQKGAILSIPFRQIFLIESLNHHVIIHYAEESAKIYETLGKIKAALPPEFCQCHKSYIINMRHVQCLRGSQFLLQNGKTVPVSRPKLSQTKDAYLKFVGEVL